MCKARQVEFKGTELENTECIIKNIRKIINDYNGIGVKLDISFIKNDALDDTTMWLTTTNTTIDDIMHIGIQVESLHKFKFNNKSSLFQGGVFGTLDFSNFDFSYITVMDNMFKNVTVDNLKIPDKQNMFNCVSAVCAFENFVLTHSDKLDLHNLDFSHTKMVSNSIFYNLHADTIVLPLFGDNYDKIFTPLNNSDNIDISIRHIKNAGDNVDKIKSEISQLYKLMLAQYYDSGIIEFDDSTSPYEGLHELLDMELSELIIDK